MCHFGILCQADSLAHTQKLHTNAQKHKHTATNWGMYYRQTNNQVLINCCKWPWYSGLHFSCSVFRTIERHND